MGRISMSVTFSPVLAACQAASAPASPPPIIMTEVFTFNFLKNYVSLSVQNYFVPSDSLFQDRYRDNFIAVQLSFSGR